MSQSFDSPWESGFDPGFQAEDQPMQSREELELVNAALVRMSINLAAQLALMDGGSFVTVRAVAARVIDELGEGDLGGRAPVGFTVNAIVEQAVATLIRRGIKVRR